MRRLLLSALSINALSFTALGAGVALTLPAAPAAAQQWREITCESWNYREAVCPAPGAVRVQLLRVKGGSCIEGQTWYHDDRAIRVRNGCRAEFDVGRRGGGGSTGAAIAGAAVAAGHHQHRAELGATRSRTRLPPVRRRSLPADRRHRRHQPAPHRRSAAPHAGWCLGFPPAAGRHLAERHARHPGRMQRHRYGGAETGFPARTGQSLINLPRVCGVAAGCRRRGPAAMTWASPGS